MKNKKSETCPHCGYCPHCGRSAAPMMPAPWVTPMPWITTPYPWWPTYPYIYTTCGPQPVTATITGGTLGGNTTAYTLNG